MVKQWNKIHGELFLSQQLYETKSMLEKQNRNRAIASFSFAEEVRKLKEKLSNVAEGRALLQGGDCAESFSDFSANNLRDL